MTFEPVLFKKPIFCVVPTRKKVVKMIFLWIEHTTQNRCCELMIIFRTFASKSKTTNNFYLAHGNQWDISHKHGKIRKKIEINEEDSMTALDWQKAYILGEKIHGFHMILFGFWATKQWSDNLSTCPTRASYNHSETFIFLICPVSKIFDQFWWVLCYFFAIFTFLGGSTKSDLKRKI